MSICGFNHKITVELFSQIILHDPGITWSRVQLNMEAEIIMRKKEITALEILNTIVMLYWDSHSICLSLWPRPLLQLFCVDKNTRKMKIKESLLKGNKIRVEKRWWSYFDKSLIGLTMVETTALICREAILGEHSRRIPMVCIVCCCYCTSWRDKTTSQHRSRKAKKNFGM